MMSYIANDIVHEFEEFESIKTMWKSFQERYRGHVVDMSRTKGIAKQEHMLNSLFVNLEAAGYPYIDEKKCLTMVNLLPTYF